MVEVEGTVPSSWYLEVKAERDRYRKALDWIAVVRPVSDDALTVAACFRRVQGAARDALASGPKVDE